MNDLPMNKVLMTGASGFVGRNLLQQLRSIQTEQVICAGRAPQDNSLTIDYQVNAIDGNTAWASILDGVDVLIHLAARVHVMQDEHLNPIQAFRETNVEGTLNLARQAVAAGVKRFIFISSIKVNGEQSRLGQPYTANDVPAPVDAYGISKHEAEQQLLALAKATGLEVVIIRPPLVYGPGVKGNFFSLMKWVRRGVPLPLGSVHNHRSLVAVENLVSLIMLCMYHPAAANQVFLVSDDEDISTSDLLRRMTNAAGAKLCLIPVPAKWLSFSLKLMGKEMLAQRLFASLQVDIAKTRELLDWCPPLTVDQGLQRCFSSKAEL